MSTEGAPIPGMSPESTRRVLVVADHEPDERLVHIQLESVAPRTDFELKILNLGEGSEASPELDEADRLRAIEEALSDFDADQVALVELPTDLLDQLRSHLDDDVVVIRMGGV